MNVAQTYKTAVLVKRTGNHRSASFTNLVTTIPVVVSGVEIVPAVTRYGASKHCRNSRYYYCVSSDRPSLYNLPHFAITSIMRYVFSFIFG